MKLATAHRDRRVREALRRTLTGSGHDLVWQATDRASMERYCRRQTPDLLLVELALLGAKAEGLPRLLESGAAVIALTPGNTAGDGYDALGLGALGLIEPPALDNGGELIRRQRMLSRIERLGRLIAGERQPPVAITPIPPAMKQARIIGLGASTGGPLALARVLGSLPADLDAAVVIVQHIESEFTSGLAEWLGSQCTLPVAIAERGATPVAGRVYIAGSDSHLVLSRSFQFGCQLAHGKELHVPSVDALFHSLAQHAAPAAAAILTGMGSDGVVGLGELYRRGWFTVAQNERSSVVYGMPRAAAEAGFVQQTLDLTAIGPALVRHLAQGRP